jgi:hypothetical protein
MSVEMTAIAVTGLLGMVGYLVQARSVQKASEAQASLERDAAEREKAEAKAGLQLERVKDQMRLFVTPFFMDTLELYHAIVFAARELQLVDFLTFYGHEFAELAAAPHTEIWMGELQNVKNLIAAPFFRLSPTDIAVLTDDAAKCQRYTELVEYTWLPPLRRLRQIISIQYHLNEHIAWEEIAATMSDNVQLAKWKGAGTSAALIFTWTQLYCEHLESLLGRWAGGDHSLLQPTIASPGWLMLVQVCMLVRKKVATRELELTGMSGVGNNITSRSYDQWGQKLAGNDSARARADNEGYGRDSNTNNATST